LQSRGNGERADEREKLRHPVLRISDRSWGRPSHSI